MGTLIIEDLQQGGGVVKYGVWLRWTKKPSESGLGGWRMVYKVANLDGLVSVVEVR